MSRNLLTVFVVAAALLLPGSSLFAHHSQSGEFDNSIAVTVHKIATVAQGRVASWHHGQITSDFPKLRQAREAKIFCFRSHPNQPHNSARLTADEGRFAIVTNVR